MKEADTVIAEYRLKSHKISSFSFFLQISIGGVSEFWKTAPQIGTGRLGAAPVAQTKWYLLQID